VHAEHRQVRVVEPGPTQLPLLEIEPERLDQVQAGAGVRAHPDDIAGIGRDFRAVQNHLKHGGISGDNWHP
jgi:hypothetical protein